MLAGAGGIGAEVVDMLVRGMPRARIAVFDLAEPKHRLRTSEAPPPRFSHLIVRACRNDERAVFQSQRR